MVQCSAVPVRWAPSVQVHRNGTERLDTTGQSLTCEEESRWYAAWPQSPEAQTQRNAGLHLTGPPLQWRGLLPQEGVWRGRLLWCVASCRSRVARLMSDLAKQETGSAGTPGLFTLCEHFPHSRLLTVKELNKLLKTWQLSAPRRSLNLFAESESPRLTRRYHHQVRFAILARLKWPLSPLARPPTATTRHFGDVEACVTEIPLRNSPTRQELISQRTDKGHS